MKVWIVQRDVTECSDGYHADTSTDTVFVASSEGTAIEYIMAVPGIEVTEYPPYTTILGENPGFTTYTTRFEEDDYIEETRYYIQEMTVDQVDPESE